MSNKNTQFKKGQIPWNKTVHLEKLCPKCAKTFFVKPSLDRVVCCSISCSKKGETTSEKQKEKARQLMTGNIYSIGRVPWNKGKRFTQVTGENNRLWKGSKVSYFALHSWVRRHLGAPNECSKCGDNSSHRYHWANIDHTYKRNLTDWIRMCPKCHMSYDKELRSLKI